MTPILFIATVLIWGTTWIAIAFQIGQVAPLVSVFFRFALAGLLLMAGLVISGRLTTPRSEDRIWLVMQGICLFSMNFLCFYYATERIPSGLSAVIFSLATIANAVNARIFFREPIELRVLLAGLIGVAGVGLLFYSELSGHPMSGAAWEGIGLATLGTLIFSLGNMISRRNSAAGIGVMQANAWAMCAGAIVLAGLLLATRTEVSLPTSPRYLGALIYLAVFGSVIGFGAYLGLVKRIGTARAAYTTVLFPIIALSLSSVFEGFEWHLTSYIGLILAITGNFVLFAKRRSGNSQ